MAATAPNPTANGVEQAETILRGRAEELARAGGAEGRARVALQWATQLSSSTPSIVLPEEQCTPEARVVGCASRVWVGADGHGNFMAESDSAITKGLVLALADAIQGLSASEAAAIDPQALEGLSAVEGRSTGATSSGVGREAGVRQALASMVRRARAIEDGLTERPFPSLAITRNGFEPIGEYAKAQADFLRPNMDKVKKLAKLLKEKRIGVVAHFYMDPEVQGVLSAVAEEWEHTFISDSLVMADRAAAMAADGCSAIAVLGVDFMAENVRAVIDGAGYPDIPVYRMDENAIGCSLAEAAEADTYLQWLEPAAPKSTGEPALHVVYINTSLKTKGAADSVVPTITCTSSNVVKTVLQAFAQVPDTHVWYGPDTHMGQNLVEMLTSVSQLPDDEVAKIHPEHTAATVTSALERLHYFHDGTCVVHDIFAGSVVDTVKRHYGDAYICAHFEVPGAMFGLAMQARERDAGVVGSTADILRFIKERTAEAIENKEDTTLSFILGTETGMVTSITRAVEAQLAEAPEDSNVKCEIVFPVSTDAITPTSTDNAPAIGDLAIVPGPAGGEGCSSEGGCASCVYMKMNTLAQLEKVCDAFDTPGEVTIAGYVPQVANREGGSDDILRGVVPITRMREFQKSGRFPDELVENMAGAGL